MSVLDSSDLAAGQAPGARLPHRPVFAVLIAVSLTLWAGLALVLALVL